MTFMSSPFICTLSCQHARDYVPTNVIPERVEIQMKGDTRVTSLEPCCHRMAVFIGIRAE
jgi:hypothetical protein